MRILALLCLSFLFLVGFSQNALRFDGSNDGLNCGTAAALDVGGKSFSLEAWVNAASWNTNVFEGSIIVKENNNNNGGFMLRAGNGGVVNFAIGAGTNGAWTELNTASILNANTWYHLAATYDGSKMKIYVDGVLKDSLNASVTVGGTSTTPLTIGYHPGYTNRSWNGRIDEVRIWDSTLSASQIVSNMNSEFCSFGIPNLAGYYKLDAGTPQASNTGVNTAKDYSGNGNNGSLSNFALTGTNSNWDYGKALYQDTTYFTDSSFKCGPYYDTDLKQYITGSTTISRHIPNHVGCDSSWTKVIIINSVSTFTINASECDSFVSPLGATYTSSGTYTEKLKNAVGCDSIITLNLIIGADSSFVDTSTCYSFKSNSGVTYTSSGTYYESFTGHLGCDSTEKLNVEILNSTSSNFTLYTCDSIQNLSKTGWLKPGALVNDTILNTVGCDSIVTINVLSLATSFSFTVGECNFYISPSGKTWTTSGTYQDTILNTSLCDSVMEIDVSIYKPTTETLNVEGCFELELPISGTKITESGTFIDTLVNSRGCDSIITTHAIVKIVNTEVLEEEYKLTSKSTLSTYQWLDCSDNFSKVVGETTKSLQLQNGGSFAVEVTENSCIDTSSCYSMAGLSVGTSAYDFGVSFVPNPSNGSFRIRSQRTIENATLCIQRLNGQVVVCEQIISSESDIYNFQLEAGVYFIKISSSNISIEGKLVVH